MLERETTLAESVQLFSLLLCTVTVLAAYIVLESTRTSNLRNRSRKNRRSMSFPSSTSGGGSVSSTDEAQSEAEVTRNQAVELLLHETRKKLVDDNPNEALCTLLEAIRLTQGEESIIGILDEAKKRVAEESLNFTDNDMLIAAQRMSIYLQSDESSLLYEVGRTDILRDAFEDGSSVVCPDCNSLVPRARAEIHQQYWCSANENHDKMDEESDSD